MATSPVTIELRKCKAQLQSSLKVIKRFNRLNRKPTNNTQMKLCDHIVNLVDDLYIEV